MTSLKIIVPVHNEETILAQSIKELCTFLDIQHNFESEILIVENGSSDNSYNKAVAIAQEFNTTFLTKVHLIRLSTQGLGHAYWNGIKHYESTYDKSTWYILTAADLPFGLSDLEVFFNEHARQTDYGIFIGSKGHKESIIEVSFLRQIASRIFRLMRVLMLHMQTRDTQGVLFVRHDIALSLIDYVNSKDFFFTTELLYRAEKKQVLIKELPITHTGEKRPSSVHILKDGWKMLISLIKLRYEKKS